MHIVVLRVAVIVRAAAAAQVEGEHAARRTGVAGERRRERLEVGAGAGQPRQADRWQPCANAGAVLLHVQPQLVLRGDVVAGGDVLGHCSA